MIVVVEGFTVHVDEKDSHLLYENKWYVRHTGNHYYVARTDKRVINGRRACLLLHREIMNPPPGMLIDHINMNGLDNRRENLRICEQRQNLHNHGMYRTNRSGYVGVSWNKSNRKWVAYIATGPVYLGSFDTREEAHEARKKAAKKMFGDFVSSTEGLEA